MKIKLIAPAAVALFGILVFTGCGEDPNGTPVYASGQGSTNGAYQATAGAQQTVYSGSSGTIVAQAQDTISRDDGGNISQSGQASIIYQQNSNGTTFRATITITNIGSGNIGVRAGLSWRF